LLRKLMSLIVSIIKMAHPFVFFATIAVDWVRLYSLAMSQVVIYVVNFDLQ